MILRVNCLGKMKQTKRSDNNERTAKKAKTTELNRAVNDKTASSLTNTVATAHVDSGTITSSKRRLILSERLSLLEQSIREIETRQIDCETQLSTACEREIRWTRQVETEQNQRALYAAQRTNQEGFLRRLEHSITQTQSAFEKLHAPQVTADVVVEERNGERTANGTNIELDALNDALPGSIISGNQSDEMECGEQCVKSLDVVVNESEVPTDDEVVELNWPDVDGFWNVLQSEPCVTLSNYLCSITSEASLKSTMDLTAREILYMDLFDSSGQHRSEAMRYTCLDFSLVANSSIAGVDTAAAAAVVVDDTTTRTPHQNDTHESTIDPNVALCPYDLAGNCDDLDCPYQHVGPQSLRTSILPRELLPLPKFFAVDEKHRASAPIISKISLGRPTDIDDPESSKPTEDIPNVAAADTMDQASDFIPLPESDERFNTHEDYTSLERNQIEFWWKKNPDEMTLNAVASGAPFSVVLQMLGATISLVENGTEVFRLHDSTCRTSSSTLTRPEWCRRAGMLLDGTRFALHSGRFDVSSAFHKLGVQLYSKLASFDGAFAPIFAGCCLDVLELSGNEIFSLPAKTKGNVFRQAFESQVRIALSSFFFQQLCFVLESTNDNLSDADLNDWAKCMEFTKEIPVVFDTRPIKTLSPEEITLALSSAFFNHDKAETPKELVDAVFSSVQTVIALRASLLLVKTPRVLIDDVLYPMIKTVRKALLTQSNGQSGGVSGGLLFLNVVLDVLQNCANQLQYTGTASDLLEANEVIDRLLLEIRSFCAELPTMGFILTPVYAANVALAIHLKRYHTANNRLANVLGARTIENQGFAPYADLLWSQIIQLRMSLPLRAIVSSTDSDVVRVTSLLEQEPDSSHSVLASSVFKMGVFPHHVFLSNDWNIVRMLFDAKRNEQKNTGKVGGGCVWTFRSSCRTFHESLICNETNRDVTLDFRNEEFMIRDGCKQLQSVSSTIPYSLLLGGSSIVNLNLSSTGMKRLPLHFGVYFPRLQKLDLSHNDLQEFPLTMDKMSALEELHFGENKISFLPESFAFTNLTLLFGQSNLLTGLPETLAHCSKLRRLNLFGNPVGPSFWRVAARLHLLELQPQRLKTW